MFATAECVCYFLDTASGSKRIKYHDINGPQNNRNNHKLYINGQGLKWKKSASMEPLTLSFLPFLHFLHSSPLFSIPFPFLPSFPSPPFPFSSLPSAFSLLYLTHTWGSLALSPVRRSGGVL